jgi:hypothetical protein
MGCNVIRTVLSTFWIENDIIQRIKINKINGITEEENFLNLSN